MTIDVELSLDDIDLGDDNIIDTVLNELDDLKTVDAPVDKLEEDALELDESDLELDDTIEVEDTKEVFIEDDFGTGFESLSVEEVVDEETGEVKDYEVSSERDFWITTFAYQDSFLDGTEMIKLIKASERIIRQSFEYSKYLGYLKNDIGMLNCAIMPNVTSDDKNVTVEMHHYPFTLYDLCETVTKKQLDQGEQVTTFSIADEVLDLHFRHLVGLVPLSKTIHELAHSGEIFINIRLCFGQIVEFTQQYYKYIPEEKVRDLAKILDLSDKQDMKVCSDKMLEISENEDFSLNVDEQLIENLKLIVKD